MYFQKILARPRRVLVKNWRTKEQIESLNKDYEKIIAQNVINIHFNDEYLDK